MKTETNSITLPTYPARPMNGGPLPSAPPKLGGRWWYEPKYNGWRVLVHTPSGTCFNRHGQRLSIEKEFFSALSQLQANCPFEWLDCEGLERRHGIGRGTLIVLDTLDRDRGLYSERKSALDAWGPHRDRPCTIPVLAGPREHYAPERPEPDSIYRAPRWEVDFATDGMWPWMQAINQRWACDFYEGLVAKRADSPYPRQLTDSSRHTSDWVKHRFV